MQAWRLSKVSPNIETQQRPSKGEQYSVRGGVYDPGNRYTYTIFIYYGVNCSEWGARNSFSLHGEALQKIIEEH